MQGFFHKLSLWSFEPCGSKLIKVRTTIPQSTTEKFGEQPCKFAAVHDTAEDQCKPVQQLRSRCKPIELTAQAFWCNPRELNLRVDWTPGNKLRNAMPPTWKERFANAGNSVATMGGPGCFFSVSGEQVPHRKWPKTATQSTNNPCQSQGQESFSLTMNQGKLVQREQCQGGQQGQTQSGPS